MSDFKTVREAAIARLGSEAALRKRIPKVKSRKALKSADDRFYFNIISFRVFSTGLKRSMVEGKWPAFQEVFRDFEPRRVRAMNDEDLEALMNDTRIIRHWGKIRATHHNSGAICQVAEEFGGFGAYIADWPAEDIDGLWLDLSKRFKHLGGRSAPLVLRFVGKDTYMPSPDAIRALRHFALYDGDGKGKREMRKIGGIITDLAKTNGKRLSEISMTLAVAVD